MADPAALDPVLAELTARIRQALDAMGLPSDDAALERPRDPDHGDWATTVALRLAKPAKRPPREIGEELVAKLALPDAVESAEVAGPGFVNFRLAHRYFEDLVRRVVAAGDDYGRQVASTVEPELVNVEFVSANPTGPLHVGTGRWAATGDAIAALLEATGHSVRREYYVNDAGEQVRLFGESVVLVHQGQELTDRHYRGDYVRDIAADLAQQFGEDVFQPQPGDEHVEDATAGVSHRQPATDDGHGALDDGEMLGAPPAGDPRVQPGVAARVGDLAVRAMRDRIESTLHQLGVDFDVWFSERTLHESGAIDAAIEQLRADGVTYESDGALFLRTEEHGDDKDRVLVRTDGRPTYFAADCAYLRDKWERGHSRLIYLLGADHHGYVARLKAAARCLGIPDDAVEVRIGQLVNLLRAGEPVRMGKRSGEFVTLDEVVEEVGVDATRYAFLRQGLDTTIDFDLAKVVEQSMENPVYYVQYAHARIRSLVRTADDTGFDAGNVDDADLSLLTEPAELELLRGMSELPEAIADGAELRATQRVTRYAEELAASFHRFYTECRILPGEVGGTVVTEELARARYWLAVSARQVLANALGVLRVSAPERM